MLRIHLYIIGFTVAVSYALWISRAYDRDSIPIEIKRKAKKAYLRLAKFCM